MWCIGGVLPSGEVHQGSHTMTFDQVNFITHTLFHSRARWGFDIAFVSLVPLFSFTGFESVVAFLCHQGNWTVMNQSEALVNRCIKTYA
jgi:creatinine amidohydrolase/Fe(II)-dependent formamide hydrolase-like protein